jgi:hypothetical protein
MTLTVDPRDPGVDRGDGQRYDDHDGRACSGACDPRCSMGSSDWCDFDAPQDMPVLAPLILRELHYHLLQSEQFGRLAEWRSEWATTPEGAIAWINEHFEALRIEALAKRAHMSPSALHHFKAVAAIARSSIRSGYGCRRLVADCCPARRPRRRSPTRWYASVAIQP